MKSLYDVLTTARVDSNGFKDLLEEYQVMDIFGGLYALYAPFEAKKAALYILYVYTINSPYVLQNEPLIKGKQRGCEKAGLTDKMRNELVEFQYIFKTKATERELKNTDEVDSIEPEDATEELKADEYRVEKIITVINAYLDYQDEPLASHLLRKKDLYDQMAVNSHRMIRKGNDVDFKVKMEANKYADDLFREIMEYEKQLQAKNASVKAQKEDIKEVERKVFNSIRPETVV